MTVKNRLMFRLLLFVLTIEFAAAQPGTNHPYGRAFTDISYKEIVPDSTVDLDIFLPDSNSMRKYPVVVIIHGGGWVAGDKTLDSIYYMRRLKSELLKNGLAVVSINYRLVGKNIHLPTPVEDCKDAIRWLRAHAHEYQLDTSNVGLWGGSAGGHLALMAAYTTNDQFAGDNKLAPYSARVNYVIDNFGPTNLNTLFRLDLGWFGTLLFRLFYHDLYQIREKLVFAMTGYQVKTGKKEIIAINNFNSPMNYVSKQNAVPTIIFHGTKDNVVPISQSEELKKALDHALAENEFIIVPNGDHGFNNIPNDDIDALIAQCIVFIKKHLR